MAVASLQPIYNRLNQAPQYHPMSAETFADWAMEAGDVIAVSRDGRQYSAPVHSSTLRWKGKQEISINSDGNREREAVSRISQQKYHRSGGGGGMSNQQELYWEMTSEDGLLHAAIHATETELRSEYQTADGTLNTAIVQNREAISLEATNRTNADGVLQANITVEAGRITQEITDRTNADGTLSAAITATATEIGTRITNEVAGLQTQIDQTDSSVGMSVGRTRYASTQTVSTESQLPAPGTPGVLYHVTGSNRDYIFDPATRMYQLAVADGNGNVNYIKTGEIALAFNAQTGQTVATIDADLVTVGRGTLDEESLPDWMDTTTGLVAQKATIADLSALRIRVETLEADSITTENMDAIDADFSSVMIENWASITDYLTVGGEIECGSLSIGGHDCLVYNAELQGTNTLRIYKTDGTYFDFSKAASVNGSWDGHGKYEVKPYGEQTVLLSTQLTGLVADGGPSISPLGIVMQDFKVMAINNGTGYPVETGAILSGNVTAAYDDGHEDGYDEGWADAIDDIDGYFVFYSSASTKTVRPIIV